MAGGVHSNNLFKTLCRDLAKIWVVFLAVLALLLILLALRELFPRLLLTYVALLVLFGLVCLSRLIASWWRQLCREASGDPKGQGSVGHQGAPSIKVPPSIYKKPDPLIYSQSYLMSLGLGVTWDNPDVHLELGGVAVPSHDLQPATTYGVKANIWNSSMEAPAVNLLVRFYYLSFGIGAARTFIGETHVDLAVKGSPMLPAVAKHDWITPETPGHYCLQVELVWADDANPANNLGQHNTDVKQLNSPNATFQFLLRNDTQFRRDYRLELDSYALPALPACGEEGDPRKSLHSRHGRSGYPVPDDVGVLLLPSATLTLGPNEEQTITVKISCGRASVARLAVNVHAFADGALAGGVTLYFHS